jgi:hypothetical protein
MSSVAWRREPPASRVGPLPSDLPALRVVHAERSEHTMLEALHEELSRQVHSTRRVEHAMLEALHEELSRQVHSTRRVEHAMLEALHEELSRQVHST